MDWLAAYLCVGAVYLLMQELQSRRSVASGRTTDPAAGLTGGALLLYRLVALPLAVVLFVLGWPAAPAVMLWELGRERRWRAREKRMQFTVRRRDLIARRTVDDIEAAEHVVDPMGAVPDLPFGHLNAAWRQFLDNSPAGSEIWSFSRKWTDRGSWEQRWGYAAVRGGRVLAHFSVRRRGLDRQARQ